MSKKKADDLKIGNVPPFGLRMHPDLKARVETAAAASNRSMNSEIVARLEDSFVEDTDEFQSFLLQQSEEAAKLREIVYKQDALLSELRIANQNLAIIGRGIGEAFLSSGDKSDILKTLATSLLDLNDDLVSAGTQDGDS